MESRFAAVISGSSALPSLSVVLLHPRHNLALPAGNHCSVLEHLHSQQGLQVLTPNPPKNYNSEVCFREKNEVITYLTFPAPIIQTCLTEAKKLLDIKTCRACNFSSRPTSSLTVPNSGSRALKWYLKLPCLSTAALKSRSVTSPSLRHLFLPVYLPFVMCAEVQMH